MSTFDEDLILLQRVPGLKNLKMENYVALSWKVRQACFIALLDNLGSAVEVSIFSSEYLSFSYVFFL